MIPTMILFGFLLGRWWKSAIVAGAVLWPVGLVLAVNIGGIGVLSAAALGAVNTAVGVAVHQAILGLVRSIRRYRPTRGSRLHQI